MSKGNFSNVFTQQHQQKIEELVALAKEQGYITYEEINEILPMSFDSPEQIDQVLIFLSGMDIQVQNQAEVDRQKERKKEAKELEGMTKRPEGTSDDPVRMYLKEMGSVPLLTREEEVEISKRIEKAQIQIEKPTESVTNFTGSISARARSRRCSTMRKAACAIPKSITTLKKSCSHTAVAGPTNIISTRLTSMAANCVN
jgi:hypothetical protein